MNESSKNKTFWIILIAFVVIALVVLMVFGMVKEEEESSEGSVGPPITERPEMGREE